MTIGVVDMSPAKSHHPGECRRLSAVVLRGGLAVVGFPLVVSAGPAISSRGDRTVQREPCQELHFQCIRNDGDVDDRRRRYTAALKRSPRPDLGFVSFNNQALSMS